MLPEIQRLVELQAADLRLAELRAKLGALPQQLAAIEKRVADARQQISSAKDALTASLKARKTYEMDVDSWREKARKYREQSFEVKTNEAYKALQHEIEHAEKEMAQAEDRLLERMVAGEEFERQLKAAERALAEVERTAEAERQKLNAEQSDLRRDVEGREAERQQIVPAVPETLLRSYENIARRRHGVALAEVRDGSCAMCGMLITPHVVQELRRADCTELFQCETCTRILYYIERPAAAAAAPAAVPGDVPPQAAEAPADEG
jgi:predicted  nucleic acid-binding Zn-ribbon protein